MKCDMVKNEDLMELYSELCNQWIKGNIENPREYYEKVRIATLSKTGKPFCLAGKVRPIGIACFRDKILEMV